MNFPNLEQKPDFPKIEESILEFWDKDNTFEKSLDKNKNKKEFIFYDGPPFATGLPHYGHLVQSAIKDVFPRYYTMKGFYVERRFGWDCHGLPVEYELEKMKGIKNRKDIETLGIDKFNEDCRIIVLKYIKEWNVFIKRLGRWVDMENDYKTMDLDYMESIWYIFKYIHDKGLIYEGYRSTKICPRCATPLSNMEVQLGYKDLEDQSVIVKFKLKDSNVYMLSWTTTPWTLPANVLLAINKNIEYVKVLSNKEYFILAKNRVEYVFENKEYEIIEKINLKDLINKEYEPFFDSKNILNTDKKGWYITEAEFVTEDEGTGIVHIAPGFGEEDMLLGKKVDAPHINHVNIEGQFGEYPLMEWAGEEARSLGEKIIEYLKEKNILFREIKIVHSYPHCWRCDTPLLNYSMNSWFLDVEKIRKNTLLNNEKINWKPEHIKEGRFKHGLEHAPDWSISRNRYWGTPLPVWKCDNCSNETVIGSIKELEDKTNKKITDIHRHFIDNLTFNCDKCHKGEMKRISEVLDCWFESGSMPYAQKHYPFENKDNFENNFPANFIAEAIDQTRGWFYSLHTIATALMNKPAFMNVITTGLIQDSSGKKLSKSKKNFTDPIDLVNLYGADALKFYLISSPVVKGEDIMFNDSSVLDVIKNNFLVIYNTLKYFTIYANTYNFKPSFTNESTNIVDLWIKSRTNKFIKDMSENMDKYNLMEATLLIQPYIDDLSNWYIRSSRQRFTEGNQDALNTLFQTLNLFAKTSAPIIPFISEHIYLNITDNKKSVHLEDFPEYEKIDEELLEEMKYAREAISELQNIRIENSIKLKQPVLEIFVNYKNIKNKEILNLIKEELNSKKITTIKNGAFVNKKTKSGEVGINIEMTQEILQEGEIREISRNIQNIRKNSNLNLNDLISIDVYTENDDLKDLLEKMNENIMKSVKANKINIKKEKVGDKFIVNDKELYIKINVIKNT